MYFLRRIILTLLLRSRILAYAATSGLLTISGTVALVNEIVVTPNGTNNSSLNITGGETSRTVASVAETSNSSLGYSIALSSANGGELRLAGNPLVKTLYKVSYNGGAFATPTSASAKVKNIGSLAGLTTNTSNMAVQVTPYPAAPAGVYSDTITITIQANP